MRPAVIVIAGLAVVSAGATAYMASSLLTPPPPVIVVDTTPPPPPKPKTVSVLVASSALERGHTVKPENLEWQEWPDGLVRRDQGMTVVPSTLTAEKDEVIKQFDGTVVRSPMVRNQPFADDSIVHPANGGLLALVLSPGNRSMTVAINAISGAGGMVQPGDLVDMLLTVDIPEAAVVPGDPAQAARRIRPRFATETIMRRLKVMSRDRSLAPVTAADQPLPTNVTLEVTPQQAEILTTAVRLGSLSLVVRPLRSGPDPERIGIPVTTDVQVMPGLQASRRNIPISELDLTENPFAPATPSAPAAGPSPDRGGPVAAPAGKVGSIIVNRWTSPQVIPTMNGIPVSPGAASQGSSSPPPAAAMPSMSGPPAPAAVPSTGAVPLQVPAAVSPPSASRPVAGPGGTAQVPVAPALSATPRVAN